MVINVVLNLKTYAQRQNSMAMSSYNTLHSVYLNPSLGSLTKRKWQIHLIGIHGNFNQNLAYLKIPFSIYNLPNNIPSEHQTQSGNLNFNKNWIKPLENNRIRNINFSSEINLPSFILRTKTNWAFGIINSANVSFRWVGLHKNIPKVIYNIENDNKLGQIFQKIGSPAFLPKMTISAISYAKTGIHLSKSFDLNHQNKIAFGVNLSKVFGFQGFQMFQEAVAVSSISDSSVSLSNGSNKLVVLDNNNGKGFSADLGITYVFHKKTSKRNFNYHENHKDYFLKLGFSILDIGYIKYQNILIHENSISNGEIINSSDYNNLDRTDWEQISTQISNLFTIRNSYRRNYNVGLPSRIGLNADYQIKKNLFISTQLIQSLRVKHSKNTREQSFLMISPRYQKKWFEILMPIGIIYDYSAFRQGFNLRLGPLYLGTANIVNFVPKHKVRDLDFFIGILLNDFQFNFKKKNKNSKDGKKNQNCFTF